MHTFLLQYGFLITLCTFALSAIGALVIGNRGEGRYANWWTHSLSALGSAFGISFAIGAFFSGRVIFLNLPIPFSFFPPVFPPFFPLRFDALSAFFVFLISIIAFATSIYGMGYQRQFYGKYHLGFFGFFYSLFIVSLLLVVSANHGLNFLIAWEVMSLASYFLVIFEYRHEENVRAGFLYFLMTHIGTAFILIALLLIYRVVGSLDFDEIRLRSETIPFITKNIILTFALIGFGTKAGIIPLHIWLPKAHPAAPSHVSALLSGVMIKTAILMLIRFFFDFFPDVSLWWGLVILIFGAISSLLGVLYALSEHDLKRLLAYHSVENIGIILLGIGGGVTMIALGAPSLAAFGLAAALYHTLNHAIFKALLFLGAGSVVLQTHTRNIEEYGGLLKRMPYTGFFFLMGAAAISALPPLNGFVSEWLTFQSLFAGITSTSLAVKGVFLLAIVSLAFTGGLAAACFVKAFGVTFLAKPRSEESAKAKESSFSLQFGMGFLTALTLIFGIGASFMVPLLSRIGEGLGISGWADMVCFTSFRFVQPKESFAILSMPWIAMGIAASFLIAFVFIYFTSKRQKIKIYGTWDCGATLTPRMEITGTGFSRSLVTIFQGILKSTRQTEVEYRDETMRYFAKSKEVVFELPNIYKQYLYDPLYNFLARLSRWTKKIQSGNVNAYLMYILLTLIGLLIWLI